MTALIVAIVIALIVGTTAVVTISGPLHALLSDICDTERRSRFWQTFTNLMLYLTPLFAVVVLGLAGVSEDSVLGVTFMRRILASALAGTLGALLTDTPHTRPVPLSGHVSSPELAERFGVERSRYEGPTGITGVLTDATTREILVRLLDEHAAPHGR